MSMYPALTRLGLTLAAGALGCAVAMAQTKQPALRKADPNAGAQAASPTASPRPAKSHSEPTSAAERALPSAPGTGTLQSPEPNPGQRMQPQPPRASAIKKGPGPVNPRSSREAP
jgi:hypothetical protein